MVRLQPKQIIGIVFFSLFLVVLIIVVFVIPPDYYAQIMGISEISYIGTGNTNGGYPALPVPNFSFDYKVTFSSLGSFSVGNPVDVTFTISNVNITNQFLTYYQGVGFQNAYQYPINKESEGIAILPFTNNQDGTFSAKGKVVWLVEGSTYLIIIPKGYSISLSNEQIASGSPILLVSGISDTLSIKTSESTAKITFLVASFSILMIEPVFESILVKTGKNLESIYE